MRYLLIIAVLVVLGACKDEVDPGKDRREQAEKDEQIILDYLSDNGITAARKEIEYNQTIYGLHYVMNKEGAGSHPFYNSIVDVKYAGYLLDGTEFDSSDDKVVSFSLGGVIPGWTYGVPLMRPGGKATFYIPSGLAYGTQGAGTIPANAVLRFDITLVNHK